MGTNIIRAGQAPNYGNPWEQAGGQIAQGLQSVLGYYQNYQQQKQREFQNQIEQQRFASEQARQQDAMDRQHMLDAEADALKIDPSQAPTGPAPTPQALAAAQPSGEAMGAVADIGGAAAPVAALPTAKPITQKKFGAYTAQLDYGGKQALARQIDQAIQLGQGVKNTPEARAMLHASGTDQLVDPTAPIIPATTIALHKNWENEQSRERIASQHVAQQEKAAQLRYQDEQRREDLRAAKANAPTKKEKQAQEESDLLDEIQPGQPETIPERYRDYVLAKVAGHLIPPRAGTKQTLADDMALKFARNQNGGSGLDLNTLKTRAELQKDLAKSSLQSLGGQVNSLNKLGAHLQTVQRASDALDKHMYSTGSDVWNALAQKAVPGGARKDITDYQKAAESAKEEYIKSLKGGVATQEELRAFDSLADPTLSKTERQSALNTVKDMIDGVANAHEYKWNQAFGVPSTQHPDVKGILNPKQGWAFDPNTEMWSVDLTGRAASAAQKAKKKTGASAPDPYTQFKSGQQPAGASGNPFDMH